MSDVREELMQVLRVNRYATQDVADAILERFDVTPKPVVTDQELGRMVFVAERGFLNPSVDFSALHPSRGRRMRDALDAAGLKIVRVSDE